MLAYEYPVTGGLWEVMSLNPEWASFANCERSDVTEVCITPKTAKTAAGSGCHKESRRLAWSSKREYFLSVLVCCGGFANVWRFPYVIFKNDGGTFLIPFVTCQLLCCLPLMLLETALGQFSGRSVLQAWGICPLMKGIGISCVVLSLLSFWCHNTVLAWILHYLVSSVQSTVPWTLCTGWWNSHNCSSLVDHQDSSKAVSRIAAGGISTAANITAIGTPPFKDNLTEHVDVNELVSAAQEFWRHRVLQISQGLEEPGHVVWSLALGLCVVMVISFLALIRGIRPSGKVVHFTATIPYVMLAVLLVRGLSLPGAKEGIYFYLNPDFSRLLDPQIWLEAGIQAFLSLGPASGTFITLSSYNHFNNNFIRDSIILQAVCGALPVFVGFAFFSVLGFMSHTSGVPIHDVVQSGPGVAFVVYSQALALMPIPQLWGILFFVSLVMLGFNKQLASVEMVLTGLAECCPRALVSRRRLITGVFCAALLVSQLPFVTQGGVYLFQLADWYFASVTVFLIGFLECVVVGGVYGVERFGRDLQLMTGKTPSVCLKLFWCWVTPGLLAVILMVTPLCYAPPTYGQYHYGPGGQTVGWLIASLSVFPVFAVACLQLWGAEGSLRQRLRQALKADDSWGADGVEQRSECQKSQRPPRPCLRATPCP